MKLAVVIPLGYQSETAKNTLKEYLLNFVSNDVCVDVYSLDVEVRAIISALDVIEIEKPLLSLCKLLEADNYDGIMVSCFDDPAIEVLKENLAIPVKGLFAPSLSYGVLNSENLAVFSPDLEGMKIAKSKVRAMGLSSNIVMIENIDVEIRRAIEFENDQVMLDDLLKRVQEVVRNGVDTIVIGCGAFTKIAVQLSKIIEDKGVVVEIVEPNSVSISMLELLVRHNKVRK